MIDKVIRTFQKVIHGWEFFEIFMSVIFFPWSLIYVGFRFVQEWETKGTRST